MLDAFARRREDDAQRFAQLNPDLCQLCHAYGADKRNLVIECFYAVHEVVPEAIDLAACPAESQRGRGYFLRICKCCRGDLLRLLGLWRNERVAHRDTPKDHDGHEVEEDLSRCIPVRMHGAQVMMTPDEYERYRQSREG